MNESIVKPSSPEFTHTAADIAQVEENRKWCGEFAERKDREAPDRRDKEKNK